MTDAQHKHDWQLTWERVVGGFQVADAHACATCPATKWSAQPDYVDEAKAAAGVFAELTVGQPVT